MMRLQQQHALERTRGDDNHASLERLQYIQNTPPTQQRQNEH
jgi:hypothetical protein